MTKTDKILYGHKANWVQQKKCKLKEEKGSHETKNLRICQTTKMHITLGQQKVSLQQRAGHETKIVKETKFMMNE